MKKNTFAEGFDRKTKPRFIDPTVDFAFKRIFGTETNKDLLIALLNELFRGRKSIEDLTYNKNEHVGDTSENGGVIFDLTCTASNGEQFIIEVQRSSHRNLKQRMLYYGSRLIADQAPKGKRNEWNYAISEVYVVVLMDGFAMPKIDSHTMAELEKTTQYLHDICLIDRDTGKLFYADYGFIYIELVNFTKQETELQSDLDGWGFLY